MRQKDRRTEQTAGFVEAAIGDQRGGNLAGFGFDFGGKLNALIVHGDFLIHACLRFAASGRFGVSRSFVSVTRRRAVWIMHAQGVDRQPP